MRRWLKNLNLGRWWNLNIIFGLFLLVEAVTGTGYTVALLGFACLAFALGEYLRRRTSNRWLRWMPDCSGWILGAIGCYLIFAKP
jgi:threonine/homoserine/homoserine lactone efflux protein